MARTPSNMVPIGFKAPKFIGKKTINTKIDLSILNKQKEEQSQNISQS